MPKSILIFRNFSGTVTGTLVSLHDGLAVVARRNSHGTHNLVLCQGDPAGTGWTSLRHGNDAVISTLVALKQRKLAYRAGAWLTRKW